jgi:hypothetical protein
MPGPTVIVRMEEDKTARIPTVLFGERLSVSRVAVFSMP